MKFKFNLKDRFPLVNRVRVCFRFRTQSEKKNLGNVCSSVVSAWLPKVATLNETILICLHKFYYIVKNKSMIAVFSGGI